MNGQFIKKKFEHRDSSEKKAKINEFLPLLNEHLPGYENELEYISPEKMIKIIGIITVMNPMLIPIAKNPLLP